MPRVAAIACLVWIGGLLLALLLDDAPNFLEWLILAVFLCVSSGLAAFFVPKYWRRGPKPVFYLLMGLLALWAAFYYQLRSPQLSETNIRDISEIGKVQDIGEISRILSKHHSSQKEKEKKKLISEGRTNSQETVTGELIGEDWKNPEQTVIGELISKGKMNSNGKIRFLFKTEFIKPNSELPVQTATGNIYLTLPKELGKKFSECQRLRVTGQLFSPPRNRHPGFLNFTPSNQDILANLKGEKVDLIGQGFCLITEWRSQIIKSQSQWLPKSEVSSVKRDTLIRVVPSENGCKAYPVERKLKPKSDRGDSLEGLLISSIVLGQKAVSLPQELRDFFSRVGLSHILAASGYQVSLLIGTILMLTQNLSRKSRFALGMVVLLLYLGLTGLQPSVVRASLIWVVILLGDLSDRRVRPLGALLIVASLILIFNPHWIGDLGFQLSFLATFGIIVSASYFEQKLDFLPAKITEIIGVTLAASLWTLPLLLSIFSQFVAVAIPLNILVTPLVEIISFGGMISAIAALISPDLGSAIAFLLYYPTAWLIQIAESASNFPILMVGQVSLLFLIISYVGMVLIWLFPWWQRRWHFVTIFLLSWLFIPLIYQQFTLKKITIFDQINQPIFAIQKGTETIIIEDGKPETEEFLLKPFLANSGINETPRRWVPFKSPNCSEFNWLTFELSGLSSSLPGNIFDPDILELVFERRHWWFFLQKNTPFLPPLPSIKTPPHVVVWVGKFPDERWLEDLPDHSTAIAITDYVSKKLRGRLKRKGIELYVTGQDGPIQWTPRGFKSAIAFPESE